MLCWGAGFLEAVLKGPWCCVGVLGAFHDHTLCCLEDPEVPKFESSTAPSCPTLWPSLFFHLNISPSTPRIVVVVRSGWQVLPVVLVLLCSSCRRAFPIIVLPLQGTTFHLDGHRSLSLSSTVGQTAPHIVSQSSPLLPAGQACAVFCTQNAAFCRDRVEGPEVTHMGHHAKDTMAEGGAPAIEGRSEFMRPRQAGTLSHSSCR